MIKINTIGLSTNLVLVMLAAAVSMPNQGHAQKAKQSKDLEEIIVTAQRREENSQDVAISVTVFTQEQVANQNMINSSDIATYTPSLSTNTRFGNENASFSIRGFTQALRTAASVGTYFAEVVAPRGQTSQTSGDGAGPGTLFDLANIQVLKGPQGTLFGRNTTGGAILLTPQRPSDEFEGFAEQSIGDYGARRQQVVFNTPITDDLRLRFGVDHNEREGHLENFTRIGADKLGNTDYTAARLSLLWDIAEGLENYTIISYADSESNGYSAALYACGDLLSSQFSPITAQPCADQLAAQAAAGKNGFYDLVSTVPTPITTIEEKRFINTTSWNATENITLKGILAYSHLEGLNSSDIFGTNFPGIVDKTKEVSVGISVLVPGQPVTSSETYLAEFQVQGQSLEGRFIWQAGLYHENSIPDGTSGNASASFLDCDNSTLEGPDPSQFDCVDVTGGLLGGVLVQRYKTEFLNQAAYFQGTFDILESLSTTVGVRYTKDKTEGDGIKQLYKFSAAGDPLGLGALLPVPIVTNRLVETRQKSEVSSEVPTGMIELNWRPLEDVMVYGKFTRGYRQGSVNLAADPGLDTHEHETVDAFEIGLKSEFGGPIPGRINIAAFTNTLKDMQLQAGYISATSGPTTAITNVGEAEINGIEIETLFSLAEGLRLSISGSILDTELVKQGNVDTQAVTDAVRQAAIDSGEDPVTAEIAGQLAGGAYTPITLEGDSLPFASEQAFTASLNYDLPLPIEFGMVTLGVTYVYTGDTRAAASGSSPNDVLPAFELWNANAAWTGILGTPFDLSVYATNIGDEEYLTYTSGTITALGFESRQVGMPKMMGARLRYSF